MISLSYKDVRIRNLQVRWNKFVYNVEEYLVQFRRRKPKKQSSLLASQIIIIERHTKSQIEWKYRLTVETRWNICCNKTWQVTSIGDGISWLTKFSKYYIIEYSVMESENWINQFYFIHIHTSIKQSLPDTIWTKAIRETFVIFILQRCKSYCWWTNLFYVSHPNNVQYIFS